MSTLVKEPRWLDFTTSGGGIAAVKVAGMCRQPARRRCQTLSAHDSSKRIMGFDVSNEDNVTYLQPITKRPAYLTILEEIEIIRKECSTYNWDSYGAKPLSSASINQALLFLSRIIAENFPIPDMIPQSEGTLALEWRNGNDAILATIEQNGIISFGAIFNNLPTYGVSNIDEPANGILHTLIQKLC